MKNLLFPFVFFLVLQCDFGPSQAAAYVPESSGNINNITVVMAENEWNTALGKRVREALEKPYEGLPLDEPQFSLNYLSPKAFTGFGRQSRNVIWFQNDSLARISLAENQFARPQILAHITGPDADAKAFYFEENLQLLEASFGEQERKEKLRRIQKAPTTEKSLENRFGISLTYPSAYETVVDSTNFVWLQKQIQKGHLNLIAYRLPATVFDAGVLTERILAIRDSIGKKHLPGRLDGSYMITEKAYLPYFYKTTLDGQQTYLTKGTWEVANDYMAGPFVNYMVQDSLNKRIMVIEGFAFAPSISKREYMFELNTILSTLKIKAN